MTFVSDIRETLVKKKRFGLPLWGIWNYLIINVRIRGGSRMFWGGVAHRLRGAFEADRGAS